MIKTMYTSRRRRRKISMRLLFMLTPYWQSYVRKFAFLYHNRVCLALTVLIQICFLSYILYWCHYALSVHDPFTQTISTCHPLPNLNVATRITFFKVTPPNCTTKLATNLPPAKHQAHNLVKTSTTNHQQESKPICFLSNHMETPEAIQQYSSHPL